MEFTQHPHYIAFTIFIIMPINGVLMVLMVTMSPVIGIGLAMLQIPNLVNFIYK